MRVAIERRLAGEVLMRQWLTRALAAGVGVARMAFGWRWSYGADACRNAGARAGAVLNQTIRSTIFNNFESNGVGLAKDIGIRSAFIIGHWYQEWVLACLSLCRAGLSQTTGAAMDWALREYEDRNAGANSKIAAVKAWLRKHH
jgi:hypothetical protein